MTNKPLIIYHDKCTDGFGAAFAAWMKFGDDAEYVACSYNDGQFNNPQDIREQVDGRDVYILDFSFSRPAMDQMFVDAASVVWLDHHKTAFEMWCDDGERELHCEDDQQPGSRRFILLDNNKSGALLAWEYFHPNVPVPELISRIDDRYQRGLRFGFDAAGLREVPYALEAYTQLMDASSPLQMKLAIQEAFRRISNGDLMEMPK